MKNAIDTIVKSVALLAPMFGIVCAVALLGAGCSAGDEEGGVDADSHEADPATLAPEDLGGCKDTSYTKVREVSGPDGWTKLWWGYPCRDVHAEVHDNLGRYVRARVRNSVGELGEGYGWGHANSTSITDKGISAYACGTYWETDHWATPSCTTSY